MPTHTIIHPTRVQQSPEALVSKKQYHSDGPPVTDFIPETGEEEILPCANALPKNVRNVGHLLLGLSVLLFCVTEYFEIRKDNGFIFFVHYIIALSYAVVLICHKAYGVRRSWKKRSLNATAILLNLFLISAFALNRDITIVMQSETWFAVYMVFSSITILSLEFIHKLPPGIRKIQSFLLGAAIALYFYSALYVVMFYGYGLIGVVLFGIGAHVFVPLTLLIASLAFIIQYRGNGLNLRWSVIGFLFPLLFALGFSFLWHKRAKALETAAKDASTGNQVLPLWATVAQSVKNDWITQDILKGKYIYQTISEQGFFGSAFRSNFVGSGGLTHDPLVLMADAVSPLKLSDEDRLKVLEYSAGNADPFTERLWAGNELTSASIETDITIFPDLRLSYTERTFNIKNNATDNPWSSDRQEAIYTFYLPSGSAVTNLSLWINGREEQGILTTKEKATNAYTQIVGVEQYDPSVIHWQEGNRVRVRVFPCTTDEERRFKIGVTSPLPVEAEYIKYTDLNFDGPAADAARDARRVRFIGNTEPVHLPSTFRKTYSGDYIQEGSYDKQFSFRFPVNSSISGNVNSNGDEYWLQPLGNVSQPATIKEVYLDINNTWNQDEVDALGGLVSTRSVYAFTGTMGEALILTASNFESVTNHLLQQNFSLFPFHKLKQVTNTVVVTKGNKVSPHLQDFPESKFAADITSFFAAGNKVNTFNIGHESSTYIASLAESRALNYMEGTIEALDGIIESNFYPLALETDDVISFPLSGMAIHKKRDPGNTVPDNAPNHLIQLFAYNDIMRKIGTGYLSNQTLADSLTTMAIQANVVTPISSLIVLETQRDYERFGIKGNGAALQHAANGSSGSVPEPHEWVLISLFIAFAIYIKFRR